jgi:replicative DNA helicase
MFASVPRLHAAGVWVDDTPGATVAHVRRVARRHKRKHGLALIAVDYLQLMRPVRRSDNREQEIAEMSRSLKELAKELAVPVVALSQLNRECEKRGDKRPMMSDLRESGAIEQDADVIIFVYRDEVYNTKTTEAGLAELIVAKQRGGRTGTVKVAFRKELTAFYDLEREYRDEGHA